LRYIVVDTMRTHNSNHVEERSEEYFDGETMDKVKQQYEAIRSSGMTNMFDVSTVQDIAIQMNSNELAEYIEFSDANEFFDMAEQAAEEYR